MTLDNLKEYLEKEYNSTLNFVEKVGNEIKWTTPKKLWSEAISRCFGAVYFYIEVTDDFDNANNLWDYYHKLLLDKLKNC